MALIVLPMVIIGVAAVQPQQGPTAGAVSIGLLLIPFLHYTPNTSTRPIDWRSVLARRLYRRRQPNLE